MLIELKHKKVGTIFRSDPWGMIQMILLHSPGFLVNLDDCKLYVDGKEIIKPRYPEE